MSETQEPRRYRQLVRLVTETPWAILPSAYETIREIVAERVAGRRLAAEEIQQRIGAAPRPVTPSTGAVAVIPIHGVIVPHADLMTEISGGTSLDSLIAQVRAAVADESVSTIILDIDSPGGSALGLREAAKEIRSLRARKPIIGVANHMAASGAYYLMSAASETVASPSALVGSVGTIAFHDDISKALEMQGVTVTMIFEPERKADGQPYAPLSDEARAELEGIVAEYYGQFVEDVAAGRGVREATVRATYGKGAILTADAALSVGMVDRIGSLDDEIRRALGSEPGKTRPRAEAPAAPEPTQGIGLPEVGPAAALIAAAAPDFSLDVAGAGFTPFAGGRDATSTTALVQVTKVAATPGGATAANHDPEEGSTMETKEGRRTKEEHVARLVEIDARQLELHTEHDGEAFPDDVQAEFDALQDEKLRTRATLKNIASREAIVSEKADLNDLTRADGGGLTVERKAPGSNVETRRNLPADVFDIASYHSFSRSPAELGTLYREGAKRINAGLAYESEHPEKVQAFVERLLKTDKSAQIGSLAQRVIVAGSEAYDVAFGKLLMRGDRALTSHEQGILQAAISHAGFGDETPVPITVDPTVLLTSDGATNPLRQIARTVSITGLTWRGLSTEGVTMVYDAELAEVVDQTPDIAAPELEVQKAHAEVRMSIEADQDWPQLRENLRIWFQDAKDTLEAEKFLHGTGADEPEGLIFALDADGTSVVETAAGEMTVVDIRGLKSALPARWRARAVWLASDAIYGEIASFGDDGDASFWVNLGADTPPLLMGKRTYEASFMSEVTDATEPEEYVLVYGDFSRGFVIVDRVGLNVEIDMHPRNSAGRLYGARALYAFFRNTSGLITPKAFRMLHLIESG